MDSEAQKPTIGRIVHYKAVKNDQYPANILAALIIKVNNKYMDSVDIVVFGHEGFGWRHNVERGDADGQWNWPKRI